MKVSDKVMSFYEIYSLYKDYDFEAFQQGVTEADIARILAKSHIDKWDFLRLLSPKAEKYLEALAQKAHGLSLQHFGKTILLYTPLYLANHCVNRCAYCSYNIENTLSRKKLTNQEIETECKAIAATGLRHILILTGESKKETPVEYITDAIKIIRKHFDSVSIEIYPLSEEEYKAVIEAGADGLTIYQEVYDEAVYDKVHIAGPKKNYQYRLDAPERACKSGIRSVNIGALLGLNDWRKEAFITALHGDYLQKKYPEAELGISLPRIRPHVGVFEDVYPVEDRHLVQIMLALRLFLPRAGITLSTREKAGLRDNLIPLGVTKMSAGVSTEVGGHALKEKGDSQFEISDKRTVQEMYQSIISKGYQPIFKDWVQL